MVLETVLIFSISSNSYGLSRARKKSSLKSIAAIPTFCHFFDHQDQRLHAMHLTDDRTGLYFDDRPLPFYKERLLGYAYFLDQLQTRGGVALDIGSGRALAAQNAVIEPIRLHSNFRSYALDVYRPSEGRRPASDFKGREKQFIYLEGHYLADYFSATARKRNLRLPQADLVSDFYGAGSYNKDFDLTVLQELALLRRNGKYTLTLDHEFIQIVDPHSESEIQALTSYFGSIKGAMILDIQVTENLYMILMQRTSKYLRGPELKILDFVAHTPPIRSYRTTGRWISVRAP